MPDRRIPLPDERDERLIQITERCPGWYRLLQLFWMVFVAILVLRIAFTHECLR